MENIDYTKKVPLEVLNHYTEDQGFKNTGYYQQFKDMVYIHYPKATQELLNSNDFEYVFNKIILNGLCYSYHLVTSNTDNSDLEDKKKQVWSFIEKDIETLEKLIQNKKSLSNDLAAFEKYKNGYTVFDGKNTLKTPNQIGEYINTKIQGYIKKGQSGNHPVINIGEDFGLELKVYYSEVETSKGFLQTQVKRLNVVSLKENNTYSYYQIPKDPIKLYNYFKNSFEGYSVEKYNEKIAEFEKSIEKNKAYLSNIDINQYDKQISELRQKSSELEIIISSNMKDEDLQINVDDDFNTTLESLIDENIEKAKDVINQTRNLVVLEVLPHYIDNHKGIKRHLKKDFEAEIYSAREILLKRLENDNSLAKYNYYNVLLSPEATEELSERIVNNTNQNYLKEIQKEIAECEKPEIYIEKKEHFVDLIENRKTNTHSMSM